MRSILILAGLPILAITAAATFTTATITPAEAAVCARGVRGAACAGPNGAVGVRRRPVVVAPVHRGVVVAPVRRRTVIVR